MKRNFLLSVSFIFVLSVEAQAQFGMGFGGGMFGPFFAPYVSPTQLVQDRRPITQNVGGPVSRPAVTSGNAYWNNLREPVTQSYTMTPRSDLRRGSRNIDSLTSQRSVASKPAAKPNEVRTPLTHFNGFFSSTGQLVWPADSPIEGEFSGKRAAVDSAMVTLKNELQTSRHPSVASIITSRNELLAYGRPALTDLREKQPARADSFHAWMLDLYNTIGKLAEQ